MNDAIAEYESPKRPHAAWNHTDRVYWETDPPPVWKGESKALAPKKKQNFWRKNEQCNLSLGNAQE